MPMFLSKSNFQADEKLVKLRPRGLKFNRNAPVACRALQYIDWSAIWTHFCQTELCALWREPCYAYILIGLQAHVLMHIAPFDRNTVKSCLISPIISFHCAASQRWVFGSIVAAAAFSGPLLKWLFNLVSPAEPPRKTTYPPPVSLSKLRGCCIRNSFRGIGGN